MKRILVLGPNYQDGRTVGGAVVLFENLIEEFENKNIQYKLIDTSRESHRFRISSLASILRQIASQLKSHDIVFLNSSEDYLILLPSIFFLNMFYRKKIFLRKFGGEVDRSLDHRIKGPIIRYYFPKLDGLFLESKFLLEKFKEINSNVFWFPNVRSSNSLNQQLKKSEFTGKFVFISQIKYSKGVKELVEAFKDFENGFLLDFYGPLMDVELKGHIENGKNVFYKGELTPKEVYSTLNKYDVLILPTYYDGEGYPGIIIEAYACGKPVISTNWLQIPEIVENGKTGYLIEPKSSLAIKEAIERINDENYNDLAQNALRKFKEFDSGIVTERILNELTQ